MKKLKLILCLTVLSLGTWLGVAADAADAPAAPAPVAASAGPKDPSLEQRVLDLEAYVNNTGRLADTPTNNVKSNVGGPGPGHNGWMMTSTALVLFMTLPGLALFYGGLVRKKNVLSVLAQCFGITGVVAVMWWAFGYSFIFADGDDIIKGVMGNFKFAFLSGVGPAPNGNYSYWVSQNVFSMYQMMFAIITPALIIGAIAERMKFSAILLFVFMWMLIVYFPLAHMVWGINGMMNGVWNANASIKAIDFAGGMVVHMSSGWSALVLCLILGKRVGYGKEPMVPHSLTLTMVGTGMLWVGWYGFNAGSAVGADSISSSAFTNTTLATAVASLVWAMVDWVWRGKPTVLGFCSGAVTGLVVITPACGFVSTTGAIIIGLAAGSIPYILGFYLKSKFGYDDALDTFGVHALGGTMGALLTGFLATSDTNPNLNTYLSNIVGHTLWLQQLKGIVLTIVLATVGTFVIAMFVKGVTGLRVSEEVETAGLDRNEYGEEGYNG